MAVTVRYKSLSVVKGATQDGLAGCQLEVRLFADGAAATTKLGGAGGTGWNCLLYTSPSPRDVEESRMPSSA